MVNWWIATGPPKYWEIAFAFGKIWGVRAAKILVTRWKKLSEGDKILFYATKPVSGVIGYGIVRTKFKQDKPLWPREVKEGKVIWPYRFEFDVEYVIPQDEWMTRKVTSDYISASARGAFQKVKESEAEKIVQMLTAKPPKPEKGRRLNVHDQVIDKLIEIGKIQGFIAEKEYDMNGERLDVVWRRVERGVPTYVFEVQVGGDPYHAIAKLKHAHDLWNSNIFIILTEKDVAKVQKLLTGTFHEIQGKIKLIDVEKIKKLFELKRAYKEFEQQIGIS